MTEELKPCPFCGGPEIASSGRYHQDYDGEEDYLFFMECKNCFSCTGLCASPDHATQAWNKRAEGEE